MPTELTEREVVDALRGLRPDVDTPDGWEAEQRARLLTFIETGEVTAARAVEPHDGTPVVSPSAVSHEPSRRRLVVVLAVAAAVVLLAAGLVTVPRWRGQEVPSATQPPTVGDGVVPFPDVYPVLPAGHPMESRVTALFDGQLDWSNEPQSWVIVGRVVDGVLTDAVRISTTSLSPAEVGAQMIGSPAGETVDALGDGWTLYRAVADVTDVVVGRRGPATVSVAGSDPVAAVVALRGLVLLDVSVDVRGEPFLGGIELPDDYRIVAGPESFVPGAMSAKLTIPDGEGAPDSTMPDPVGDEGDGITVYVGMTDPFVTPIDGLRQVDIGDGEGWLSTVSGAPMVAWKVSDTTWATVWDAGDTDAALAFARSLQFVDRATWVARYAVPDPRYPAGPSPDSPTAPGSTGAGVADERECQVIGVEPLGQDVVSLSSEAPVGGVGPSGVDPGASRRIEIDCGAADGLRVGMPVTFESGLIGKITQLADDTSVVMLVGDSQFFALADVPEAGAFGSVRGSGSDGGAEISVIEQDDAESVESGMLVVTAGGERALAPPGIPIGRIVGPGSDDRSFTIDLWSPSPGTGAAVSVVLHVPEVDRVEP